MGKYVFGVDIGGTSIKCGLFTETGILEEKWELPTRRENRSANITSDIAKSLQKKCEQHNLKKEDVTGVGVGVPGPVRGDGVVIQCVNLGWEIYPIEKEIAELTGFPVKAANDANVAALGEMWKGGGKGYQSIVFVTLGTGVGGGVVIDGNVIHGSCGAAGEIGHLIVEPEETAVCACGGRGHLEQYASATGIVWMAKRLLAKTEEPSALRNMESFFAKQVFDEAKNGDLVAKQLVEKMCRYLGHALANVATVVDPEAFVIGGGVSKAGSMLTDMISKYYNSNQIKALKNKKFHIAELGNDAGIYGSARLLS